MARRATLAKFLFADSHCSDVRLKGCIILYASVARCRVSDTFAIFSDPKVPFVPSEKEYEMVFVREGERVVIPCRGSLEDLNVTLHTVRKTSFSSLAWCFASRPPSPSAIIVIYKNVQLSF